MSHSHLKLRWALHGWRQERSWRLHLEALIRSYKFMLYDSKREEIYMPDKHNSLIITGHDQKTELKYITNVYLTADSIYI